MVTKKYFGLEFRQARERAGLTAKDLACTTGIELDFILASEAGFAVLTISDIEKIISAVVARFRAMDQLARRTK